MVAIRAEISPGELIDKITILQIKAERISDADKLPSIEFALSTLQSTLGEEVPASDELERLSSELKTVNERLWVIEDDIRDCEREKDFGPKFIELARSVYRTNDVRAALKRRIDEHLGSQLVEQKSYQEYE